jgi:hypothetical protein
LSDKAAKRLLRAADRQPIFDPTRFHRTIICGKDEAKATRSLRTDAAHVAKAGTRVTSLFFPAHDVQLAGDQRINHNPTRVVVLQGMN